MDALLFRLGTSRVGQGRPGLNDMAPDFNIPNPEHELYPVISFSHVAVRVS
jgi:hypothetical protein